ncbi:MAG: hypothetical protein U9N04_03605 [Patescibacteria group bacterium]|nr:hypothetical protein [Patescibacteria group bacterium]
MEINNDIHYYDSANKKLKKNASSKMAILLSALVLSVAIVFFLVSPEFRQMKLIKLEQEMVSDNLELKKDLIDRIAKFNKTNKGLDDDDLKKIYNLLPEDGDFNKQMASINKFATFGGNRILIKSFSANEAESPVLNKTQNREDTPDFKETHLDFSFSGNFEDFMSLFDSVEKNIPLIDIKSLNITRENIENMEGEEENIRENILNCEVVFSLYHL